MAEKLSNDTNEIEYNYENYYPRMMCPYFAGGSTPIGAYPFYPVRSMGGMMSQMPYHEALIQTVQNCEVTCEHMTTMVIEMNDVHMRRKQLELLHDCADVCTLMAKLLARHSKFMKSYASFCADVCEACGNECSRFPDAESQRCARICLDCAKECREHAMSMM